MQQGLTDEANGAPGYTVPEKNSSNDIIPQHYGV
jgi:hypothetical protein